MYIYMGMQCALIEEWPATGWNQAKLFHNPAHEIDTPILTDWNIECPAISGKLLIIERLQLRGFAGKCPIGSEVLPLHVYLSVSLM